MYLYCLWSPWLVSFSEWLKNIGLYLRRFWHFSHCSQSASSLTRSVNHRAHLPSRFSLSSSRISGCVLICWWSLSFFLSFLVRPLLPTHCRCRMLLLHLTELDTHTHTHTFVRAPLNEGSVRRRDLLYLTTHNIYKKQTFMPPAGFEPAIPASQRSRFHS